MTSVTQDAARVRTNDAYLDTGSQIGAALGLPPIVEKKQRFGCQVKGLYAADGPPGRGPLRYRLQLKS